MIRALGKLRQALFDAATPERVLEQVSDFISSELFADRVLISDRRSPANRVSGASVETVPDGEQGLITVERGRLKFEDQLFTSAVIVSNSATSRLYGSLENTLRSRHIRSFAAIPLFKGARIAGVIEIHYCQLYQRWQRSDLAFLDHIGDLCSAALERFGEKRSSGLPPGDTERQFDSQSRRIQALYELSRSLTIDLDPAIVALRGLKSLIKATSSAAGVCAFLEPGRNQLEIVAAEGVSANYVENLSAVLNEHSLLQQAVAQRDSFRISDLREDQRAAREIAADEGLGAAVVVPLIYEDQVYGALAIFHRDGFSFSREDFELVSAAGQLICLIARQAEYYSAEKRNARSLNALYKLTHELSKYFTAKEVAEHAFPIIQDEFPCKRMWLATLNEQGTHLVGQAGFGPGMRKRIVSIQIQRARPHQFLDQALDTRLPVVVPAGTEMDCSGLRMIVRRLELGTLVILPLVSLGQAVGALVLEPENGSSRVGEGSLGLLSRMAGEIGTVILARRFESRMASDDKMRTAGLIASGVAHNFNNLLQAIMGQSSLIEMQLPKDSPLVRSAQLIVESSHRGAGLIKQLVACTVGETQNIERVNLASMIEDSRDFYRSILGSPISLTVSVGENLPAVSVDYGRVQQTIANILVHAKDAIGSRTDGEVSLEVSKTEIESVDSAGELLPGTYAVIRIKDNGQGLDRDQQSRIFEPFFALYNEDPRSQLGGVAHVNLSAGYALIRNYGGTITVTSDRDKGSEFSILIPEDAPRAAERRGKDQPLSAPREPAVVMLDMEETVMTSITALVESLGLAASSVRKRQKIRELLGNKNNVVRVVIIDSDRSSEDLVGFIREIAGEFPTVRILLSTFDPRRWERLLRGIERVELLPKPLSIWALDKVLRNVVLSSETGKLDLQVERDHGENGAKTDSPSPAPESEAKKYEDQ